VPAPYSGRLAATIKQHPVGVLVATAIVSLGAAVVATIGIQSASQAPRGQQRRSAAQARRTAGSPSHGLTRPDLGRIWGVAFRGQAATYERLARVETEANAVPAHASVDRRINTIRFTGATAGVTIVANPPTGRDMAFRSAGLENPTIDVSQGAVVTVHFINGDSDSAHGWLLLDPIVQVGRSFHGPRAFPNAYAPILGDPTSKGQPVETIRFRATIAGTYRYECPVPGHAAMGMQGVFSVTA
jgi:hypothetical protein